MAFNINNFGAGALHASLGKAERGIQRSWARMASGRRLNTAADGAAGIAISEALDAQSRSYAQAERNIGSALSMARTADSGAGAIGGMLIRMRELAMQSADGALSDTDRGYLDTEFQQLKAEVDRISESTELNGQELLGGPAHSVAFQVGTGTAASDQVSIDLGGISSASLGIANSSIAGFDGSASTSAIDAIDDAMSALNTKRANFGAMSNRFAYAYDNAVSSRTQMSSALSTIRDADYAAEASSNASHQLSLRAAVAVFATANQLPSLALRLLD